MMISKACVYAIQAVSYLAKQNKQQFFSIQQISKDLNISYHFLTKILQVLTLNNITTSCRGANGGISLSRAPEKINLVEIVTAIDGEAMFHECILGLPGCGSEKPCILHDDWSAIRTQLVSTFQNTTLSNISKRLEDKNIRLSDEKN